MGQANEEKVLEVFFEHPDKSFTVREIAKLAAIPRATAHKLIKKLKKESFITKDNRAENNLLFTTKKINFYIEKIVSSGLIDELVGRLNPSCIILFGSVRKGDSAKESDIDIFIETPIKKEISLNKFEKKLRHKVQLFVESDINRLQSNLYNNVVNGIKLYGSFKIK